jgi:hypothetical protein
VRHPGQEGTETQKPTRRYAVICRSNDRVEEDRSVRKTCLCRVVIKSAEGVRTLWVREAVEPAIEEEDGEEVPVQFRDGSVSFTANCVGVIP